MTCRHCNKLITGMACPCFADRAKAENLRLSVDRFLAGEVTGCQFGGHVFIVIEPNSATALCGFHSDKRLPVATVLHVSAENARVACAGCSGGLGR